MEEAKKMVDSLAAMTTTLLLGEAERMKELEEEAPQQEAPVSPAAAPSDRPLVGGEREHLEGEEEEEERGSAIADEQK